MSCRQHGWTDDVSQSFPVPPMFCHRYFFASNPLSCLSVIFSIFLPCSLSLTLVASAFAGTESTACQPRWFCLFLFYSNKVAANHTLTGITSNHRYKHPICGEAQLAWESLFMPTLAIFKVGQTYLVLVYHQCSLGRVHARLQVPVCSGYDLCHTG